MVLRHWVLACSIFVLLNNTEATAQSQVPLPGVPQASAPAKPSTPAAAAPAPQVNSAEIVKRANESVGTDIEAKIKAWQKELDSVEDALRGGQGLRYNQLNAYRDGLLGLRADAEEFWKKLQGPLNAMDEQVQKLPPAPAQGQPPEPEQAALFRAELTYHLGILTSARNSLDATHFRINQLINRIQDIRRTNFTNNLLQPVPGVFSMQTWETVPEYARLAVNRVQGEFEEWWRGVSDRQEIVYLASIALVIWLVLGFLAWRGVRWLRNGRRDGGDPPFGGRGDPAQMFARHRSHRVSLQCGRGGAATVK
jgi:potassium efflux system protein